MAICISICEGVDALDCSRMGCFVNAHEFRIRNLVLECLLEIWMLKFYDSCIIIIWWSFLFLLLINAF